MVRLENSETEKEAVIQSVRLKIVPLKRKTRTVTFSSFIANTFFLPVIFFQGHSNLSNGIVSVRVCYIE